MPETGDPQVSNRSHATARESSPLYSAGYKGLRQATRQGLKGLDAAERPESRFFCKVSWRNGYSGVGFSPCARMAQSASSLAWRGALVILVGFRSVRCFSKHCAFRGRRRTGWHTLDGMICPDDLPVTVDAPTRDPRVRYPQAADLPRCLRWPSLMPCWSDAGPQKTTRVAYSATKGVAGKCTVDGRKLANCIMHGRSSMSCQHRRCMPDVMCS